MKPRRVPGRRAALATALPAAALLVPTAAHAQSPTTPAPATPAPAPVQTKLTLVTERARTGEVLKGTKWRALAVTDQFVAGTKVRVSYTAGKRRVSKLITLKQQKDGEKGYVRMALPSKVAKRSRVVVRASIPNGMPIVATIAKTRVVRQATPNVSPGERGLAVRMLQEMLAKKAYVVGRKGVYDARTQRAVLAFRKVVRMDATSEANSAVFRRLVAGKGTFHLKFPNHGRHVEGDIERRVLVLADKGKAIRIYHTSPGKPSTPTIRGSFHVYMKDPGTNAKGMFKSSYFIRGYAVHGYPSVPAGYSASHGCFRVPMSDAPNIYAFMTQGMPVDTY